jgi:hypothetical protein
MNCRKRKKKKKNGKGTRKMLRRLALSGRRRRRNGPSIEKRHVFEKRNDLGHSCHSVPLWNTQKKVSYFIFPKGKRTHAHTQ